jgi:type VI protein secretion system component VasF
MTINAEAYALALINQDGYAGEYYDVSADELHRVTFTVKHTIPKQNGDAESHLIRVDDKLVDSEGEEVRTDSVWVVLKCSGAAQNTAQLIHIFTGLVNTLQASTNAALTAVLGRES